jgi:hypothetical protein
MRYVLWFVGLVAFLAIILIAIGIGEIGSRVAADSSMQPSKKQILEETAKQMNESLPMMVDPETRLDSVTPSIDGSAVSYAYTLVSWRADQLSATDMVAIRQQVIDQTCSTQDATLLRKGVALEFAYQSSDGTRVQEFRIIPGSCVYDQDTKGYTLIP